MKLDIHNHILPENWPNFEEVLKKQRGNFSYVVCNLSKFCRNSVTKDG